MSQQMKQLYEFGHFTLDMAESRLLRDGRPVPLKPKVLETLLVLIESSGHVLEKQELMQRLWPDSFVEEANLTVNISQLRRALGDDENGERFIETVPKRGYRFAAQVTKIMAERADLVVHERTRSRIVIEEHETDRDEGIQSTANLHGSPAHALMPSALALPQTDHTTHDPKAWVRRNKTFSAIIGVTVVTAMAVATYFVARKPSSRPEPPLKPNSLAILPFRNLRPNAETDFLGPSMADAVINRLSHIRTLMVRPSSYVQKYGKQDIDPQVAARELSVDKVVTGSFLRDGDNLRVTAQLIDVNRGDVLWNETIDVKYEKLLTMEDRVAEQIIKGLRLNLSPAETERLKIDAPQNPRAYEAFLYGRHLISGNEHQKAIKLLEESVSLDPNYALAWTYLGKAYSVTASQYFGGREFHDKAQAAYEKALALKPQLPETRMLLANFLTENNRVEEAVPILRKVIEENPNHSLARWELSYAYRYSGMLDQSIAEGESALQLDPHITGHLFNSYLYAGEHEKFVNSLPMRDDPYTLFYRGLGHYYMKDWARASVYFDRAHQLDSGALVSQLGEVLKLAMDGHNREGLELLKVIESKLEKDPFGDGELSYKLAECYSVLEDRASALRLLKKSIDQGFFCYPYFVSDPLLDNIRGETQYAALIEKARQRHERFKQTFF
jgi:DNA-binding winged helix-turn-helix (wHTH) protein/TolB-like protein/Tfp pilus assembly protein PilF